MFFDFFFLAGEALFKNPPLRTPGLKTYSEKWGKKEEKIDLFPLS